MTARLQTWRWWLAVVLPELAWNWLRRPSPFHYALAAFWLLGLMIGLLLTQPTPNANWGENIYAPGQSLIKEVGSAAGAAEKSKAAPPVKSASTSASVSAHPLEGPPTIGVAKIEQVLQQYNSPAAGKGQVLYDLGLKYGIDPAYALAFFIHESSAGTKGIATVTKSIGNIRQTAGSGFDSYQGFRKYPSWEAGIEDWYKLIKQLYIQVWNLRSVEAVIPTYAPSADRNDPAGYINAVNRLVESWRG